MSTIILVEGSGPQPLRDGSGLSVGFRSRASNEGELTLLDSANNPVATATLRKDEEVEARGYKFCFRGFSIEEGIISQPLNPITGKPLGGLIHPTIATIDVAELG